MLSLTHAAVGGALGSEIANPGIAFGLGVVAHFVADKVPHFWPESKKGKTIVMVTDIILTVGILIYFLILTDVKSPIFWGAAGGGAVDAVLVLTPLYETKIGQWHTNRQPHKTKLKFLAADIGLIIIAALWLYFRGI